MRFKGMNGDRYASNNKVNLAWEMYKTSFAKGDSENIHEWGIEVCNRINEVHETEIKYHNPVQLVNDLIKYNIIKELH
jgi:hypothetical protein